MSSGVDEVLRNLNNFAKNLLPEAMESGMEKATLLIERSAKQNAPIDLGQLKKSIESKTESSGLNVKGSVFTNLEYATYVHEGTGIYAKSGGRKTPWIYKDKKGNIIRTVGQKPVPFLENAVDENVSQILSCFKAGAKW